MKAGVRQSDPSVLDNDPAIKYNREMHVDKDILTKALKRAASVSKRAPIGSRNTRVSIEQDRVTVTATDGAVWYQRVVGPGDPVLKPMTSSSECRVFIAGSDELVRAVHRCRTIAELMPHAVLGPLCASDPSRDGPEWRTAIPLQLLDAVAFSATRDRSTFRITGISLQWDGAKLWAKSTDGRRLTHASVPDDAPERDFVVPLDAVEQVLKVFGSNGTVPLVVGSVLQFGFPDIETISVRPELVPFPNSDRFFQQTPCAGATGVQRINAIPAARAVGGFTGRHVDVVVSLTDSVNFDGSCADVPDSRATCRLPALSCYGKGTTRVNAKYLADALERAPDAVVEFLLPDPSSDIPLVLRAETMSMSWATGIMPIRV